MGKEGEREGGVEREREREGEEVTHVHWCHVLSAVYSVIHSYYVNSCILHGLVIS